MTVAARPPGITADAAGKRSVRGADRFTARYSKNFRLQPVSVSGPGTFARL